LLYKIYTGDLHIKPYHPTNSITVLKCAAVTSSILVSQFLQNKIQKNNGKQKLKMHRGTGRMLRKKSQHVTIGRFNNRGPSRKQWNFRTKFLVNFRTF